MKLSTLLVISMAAVFATTLHNASHKPVHALVVHGYDGPVPHKVTDRACLMAKGQDVVVVAGTAPEMRAMAAAMRTRCAPALAAAGQPDGDKLRVLPWSANNTAEHVQCAAKLLHATTSARLVLTQMGFEFVMPRAQRTTAVLRQGADNAPFFDRVTLLFSGVNTSAVDAWRHEDEINYNSTAAIRADTDRARAGPCAVARVEEAAAALAEL